MRLCWSKESQDFPKESSGAIVVRKKECEPRSSALAVGVRGAGRSAWSNGTLPPVP